MLPEGLRRVVHLLARLPGVGEKSAQRHALYLAQENKGLVLDLSRALEGMAARIKPCSQCLNICEADDGATPICDICKDTRRDPSLLCIVGRVQDLLAIERSGAMRGYYFVLGRLLSPLDGIGPEQLPLQELSSLLDSRGTTEAIIATPPSVDGEATALFLAQELGRRGVRASRIASGVPHGGDLEFADQVTLLRSITGRKPLSTSEGSEIDNHE